MSLQHFAFPDTGQAVRTLDIDGQPWFVAADVCAILGITQPHRALAGLDTDEKGRHSMTTPGGEQVMSTVSESGLYSLILRSRKPEAKRFRKWVTAEVLPQIHRTGAYSITPAPAPGRRELAQMVLDEADRADAAEARAAALAPAAESWDRLADATGDFSVRQAAQILSRDPAISVGQNRLFSRLRTLGWVDTRGEPYQKFVDAGWLVRRTTAYSHPHTDEPVLTAQVRVTARGISRLRQAILGGAQLALHEGGGAA